MNETLTSPQSPRQNPGEPMPIDDGEILTYEMFEKEISPEDKRKQLDSVYKDVLRNEKEALGSQLGPDVHEVDTIKLSRDKSISMIDTEKLDDHEQALWELNTILKGFDHYDIRDLPKLLGVPRGKMSALEHKKAQAEHLEKVANVIDARIEKRNRDGDYHDKKVAHNKRLAEQAKATKNHERKVQRAAKSEVEAHIKEMAAAEFGRLALVHGHIFIERDPELEKQLKSKAEQNARDKFNADAELKEIIENEAGQKAKQIVGEAPKDPNAYYYDSDESKEVREKQLADKKERAVSHKSAVDSFHRSFNKKDKDPSEEIIEILGLPEGDLQEIIDQDSPEEGEDVGNKTSSLVEKAANKPQKRGWLNRVKETWNAQPAVRFDGKDHNGNPVPGKKVGEAIVDERYRKYEKKHVVALGALALVPVVVTAAGYANSKGVYVDTSHFMPNSGNGEAPLRNVSEYASTAGRDLNHIKDQAVGQLSNSGASPHKVLEHAAAAGDLSHAKDSIVEQLSSSNGTVWEHVSKHLGENAKNVDVERFTKRILDANGLTWDEARHLPDNYKFNVPRELIEQMHKIRSS